MERQNERAVLMDVIPRPRWRYCKVDNDIVSDWLPVDDFNDQRLCFRSVSSVDVSPATYERRDSQCAPNTKCPPRSRFARYPVNSGSERKRVNDPRLANMGMQNQPVYRGELAQQAFHLRLSCTQSFSQNGDGRTRAMLDQSFDQLVMQSRERFLIRHSLHYRL